MNQSLVLLDSKIREQAAALFRDAAPLLAEVRFPRSGTSSDWHLLEDEEELERVLEVIAAGVEIHLSSVWDLRSAKGPLVVRKK